MKVSNSIILLLLVATLSNLCYSQIQSNFEFLQHRHDASSFGAVKYFQNELYFVSHYMSGYFDGSASTEPLTKVFKVTANQEIEELFSISDQMSTSEIIDNPDSTFHIIIHSIYGIGGFVDIHITDTSTTIDTFTSQAIDSQEAPVFGENISNIAIKSDGTFISIGFDSISYITNTGAIDRSPNSLGISPIKLFTTGDNRIFGIFRNFSDAYHIYELIGYDLILRFSIPDDVSIRPDLLQAGQFLCTRQELMQFDNEFQTIINSWLLPSGMSKFVDLNQNDSTIRVMATSDSESIIYELLANGELMQVDKLQFKNNEVLIGFQVLTDTQYLIEGYSYSTSHSNPFWRSVEIGNTTEIDYPRVDIDLSDLEFRLINSDTTFTSITQSDTIHFINYTYGVSYSIENNGLEKINISNSYTFDQFVFLDGVTESAYEHFTGVESYDIDPLSTIKIDTIFKTYELISEIEFAVPGGNYKFNENLNLYRSNLTTDLEQIPDIENFIIYPNPCRNRFEIHTSRKINQLSIYNKSGILVYTIMNPLSNEYDISFLDTGLYIVRCVDNFGLQLSAKLIKH